MLKTELPDSPLGKTVKLDSYGNPIYDVQIRKVVKRADGKYWNVPIDDLSERFAVLEIRSRDLHEAAALFAHLPGHQEEPEPATILVECRPTFECLRAMIDRVRTDPRLCPMWSWRSTRCARSTASA